MSRRNTRLQRDILYQEDSFGEFSDIPEYLAVKDPKRYNRKKKHNEKVPKKSQMRGKDSLSPDIDLLPAKKKLRGNSSDFDTDRFY